MKNVYDLMSINDQKGLPRSYRFNQFIRWFTIFLATAAIAYSIWLIFSKVNADSSKFAQFVPFAIMFLALNSLLKNIFSLNSIRFTKDFIKFNYLAKKGKKIFWKNIKKLSLNDAKRKMIRIHYLENEEEQIFEFPIAFPKMLEIINSIAELCEDVEYDEFVQNVIIDKTTKDKVEKNDSEK